MRWNITTFGVSVKEKDSSMYIPNVVWPIRYFLQLLLAFLIRQSYNLGVSEAIKNFNFSLVFTFPICYNTQS